VYAVAGAAPAQSRVAQVAHRGFHLLAQAIRAQAAAQPPTVDEATEPNQDDETRVQTEAGR
jgi:hypothetical protein